MKIEDIQQGTVLLGVEVSGCVTIAAVVPISDDSVQVIYKTGDGSLKDRLIGRFDEGNIRLAEAKRPWSFDGDGDQKRNLRELEPRRQIPHLHHLGQRGRLHRWPALRAHPFKEEPAWGSCSVNYYLKALLGA